MDVSEERKKERGKNGGGAGRRGGGRRKRRGRRDGYWDIGNTCLGGRDERKRMIAGAVR